MGTTFLRRAREGQIIKDVSKWFSGLPKKGLKDDLAVAVDDERPDGAVLVAGFDLKGQPWSGVVARIGQPHEVVGDESPHPVSTGAAAGVEEAGGEGSGSGVGGQSDESNGDAEGEGGGEDDPLLALIKGVAMGLDEISMAAIKDAMHEDLRRRVDEQVKAIDDKTAAKLEEIALSGLTLRNEVVVNEQAPVQLPEGELVHAELTRLVAVVASGFKNAMLVGPAGCGKTTLARQLAKAIGAKHFAAISCSPGMSEAKVLGRIGVPTESNPTGYMETAVMQAFRLGGVILFDEMDNADASMMVSFNAMTDGGFATLPNGEVVERHPDTVIIAACNTFGHGADRMYVGRNQLDAATLDRFVGATLEMDYDRDLEAKLVPNREVLRSVWDLRDKVRRNALRRVVSTRAVVAADRRVSGLRESMPKVLGHLTLGWSKADKMAVGLE